MLQFAQISLDVVNRDGCEGEVSWSAGGGFLVGEGRFYGRRGEVSDAVIVHIVLCRTRAEHVTNHRPVCSVLSAPMRYGRAHMESA